MRFFPEPSHTGEQQSDPSLPEAFYQPHLTNQPQPSEERNVSRTNEEGTVMTLSTRNVKRPGKRTHSQSTLDQGTVLLFTFNVLLNRV